VHQTGNPIERDGDPLFFAETERKIENPYQKFQPAGGRGHEVRIEDIEARG